MTTEPTAEKPTLDNMIERLQAAELEKLRSLGDTLEQSRFAAITTAVRIMRLTEGYVGFEYDVKRATLALSEFLSRSVGLQNTTQLLLEIYEGAAPEVDDSWEEGDDDATP